MAILNSETVSAAAGNFAGLPITRQLGLLVGLAVSVALGVAVVVWSIEPNYRPLKSNMNSADASEVIDVLQRNNFEYKIDKRHGAILVSAEDIHEARLKLSAEGLPRGSGHGFEILKNGSSFGSSQFMEAARYKHAQEGELARTIMNIESVKSARVHLAIPQRSVFVRDQQQPSASVFVDLYSGGQLDRSQISSIVHLVASSVQNLQPGSVTVVDQHGKLLTDGSGNDMMALASRQFDYKRTVEESYKQQIQQILMPILGGGKVQAQVSAELDYTSTEQTQESFKPDKATVRSEHTIEETQGSSSSTVGGVPGIAPSANGAAGAEAQNGNSVMQATRNFELDKTISHTQNLPGRIKRLSVAVVVDDHTQVNKAGKVTRTPLTDKEVEQLRTLVRDAVGFNEGRGDSVTVINSAFAEPAPIEQLAALGFWQEAWFWSLVKQGLGGLFVLLLTFFVVRPAIKGLATRPVNTGGGTATVGPDGTVIAGDGGNSAMQLANQFKSLDDQVRAVKSMADSDPKRVAQVVKSWVDKD